MKKQMSNLVPIDFFSKASKVKEIVWLLYTPELVDIALKTGAKLVKCDEDKSFKFR